jgi:DNA repair protein RecN (Recombination protein N)
VEANPDKLNEINDILQLVYKLQQKHTAADIPELIEIRTELEQKINATIDLDDRIEALQKKHSTAREKAYKSSEILHKNRVAAVPLLQEKLEGILKELGLPNARFQFDIQMQETFRKHGMDTLELLFTANKGLAFGPIKKVASGGELSRIMLAVKAVLANYKRLPTIIFDEIDSGVSGEIANKMAAIMGQMSQSMQLMSITHLPQIASKGDRHVMVYKEDVNEVTVTRLKELDNDERIVEIAKMIGGNRITEAALANARELLN